MENNDQIESIPESHDVIVTDEIKSELLATVKWSKYLAILNLVSMFLLILWLIAGISVSSSFLRATRISFFPYLLIVLAILILTIPIFYLYKFSLQIKKALKSENEDLFKSGFNFLKKHYKFIGVFLIITLIFYGIMFLLLLLYRG